METKILFWTTILLIIINYSFSLRYLFLNGKVTKEVILLNCIQLILFCRLHVLIHNLFGADHYIYSSTPIWYDWFELVLIHVLRAVDIVDLIGAYGFNLQNIQHNSLLAGIVLFSMHIMVDIFLLGAIFIATKPKFTLNAKQARLFWVVQIITILIIILFIIQLNNNWSNWFLWPLDNLLRTLDFGDAFQIFDWQLHSLDKSFELATLAVIFRIIVGFHALKIANNLLLKLSQGKGKTIEKLTSICVLKKYSETEANIAFQALLKFDAIKIQPHLANILLNGQFHFRRLAAENLVKNTNLTDIKPIIPYFIAASFDSDNNVRRVANDILHKITLQPYINTAIPFIISKLLSLDATELRTSVVILKMRPEIAHKIIIPLAKLLTTNDCQVAITILSELREIAKPAKLHLIKALVNADMEIQLAVEDALYNIDSEWQISKAFNHAAPWLIKALFNNDTSIIAKKYLKSINFLNITTKYSDLSVSYIITALQNKEPNVRKAAINIAEQFSFKAIKAVPYLKKLHDNDWQVGGAAGKALEHILNNIDPIAALSSKDSDIRYAGILSLEKRAIAEDIPHISIATTDSNFAVRKVAKQILAQLNAN